MANKRRSVKIFLIIVLVLVTTLSHYLTEQSLGRLHIFYQGLYFVPIILAGFWFALKGSLATSLGITAAYLPFTIMNWKGFGAQDVNNLMELVLYNAVAVIIGLLKSREQAEQKRLREADRWAAMGKAVSTLAHELKNP
ncbi:MAG: hypothetical protein AB1715_04200, partial [Acidobacteriota bacterium]